MLLVVMGAGASYDSDPRRQPRGLEPKSSRRPPLAKQLFDDREHFVQIQGRFPDCMVIAAQLQYPPKGKSLEQQLQLLQKESQVDPIRQRQLLAVRYYLQCILWQCEMDWVEQAKGATNHASLVDQIRHFLPTSDQVCFVTFNYDRLLETALRGIGLKINALDDYITDRQWKLIKLHGSVNWAREIETPIDMAGRGNAWEVAAEVISKADGLKVSSEYRLVSEYPGGGSGGLLPAIAIPLQDKLDFECPDTHVQALRAFLPQADSLLLIGWRASEKQFVELLRTLQRKPWRCVSLAGTRAEARNVVHTLRKAGVRLSKPSAYQGFTEYMLSDQLRRFLSRGEAKQIVALVRLDSVC